MSLHQNVMGNLHEIEELITKCNNIRITFENFFAIAQCLEHEINSEHQAPVILKRGNNSKEHIFGSNAMTCAVSDANSH